jgi:hypothetical protein
MVQEAATPPAGCSNHHNDGSNRSLTVCRLFTMEAQCGKLPNDFCAGIAKVVVRHSPFVAVHHPHQGRKTRCRKRATRLFRIFRPEEAFTVPKYFVVLQNIDP